MTYHVINGVTYDVFHDDGSNYEDQPTGWYYMPMYDTGQKEPNGQPWLEPSDDAPQGPFETEALALIDAAQGYKKANYGTA